MKPTPITSSPLSTALGVNGVVMCDCGSGTFKIGIAYNPTTGNNFLRVLECIDCGHQMPATHRSDDGTSPALADWQGQGK